MVAQMRPDSDYVLGPFLISSIAGGSTSQKIPVPMRGQVVGVYCLQDAESTGGVATITAWLDGVAMTSVNVTVPNGDAGDVNWNEIPPLLATGAVDEGEELSVDSDGGSSGAGAARIMLRIRRM